MEATVSDLLMLQKYIMCYYVLCFDNISNDLTINNMKKWD